MVFGIFFILSLISSIKNKVFCTSCDFSATIDKFGYFDESCKFKTVAQWDDFQQEELKSFVESKNKENSDFLFENKNAVLKRVKAEHQEEVLGCGTFSMFTDKFIFCVFPQSGQLQSQEPHLHYVQTEQLKVQVFQAP